MHPLPQARPPATPRSPPSRRRRSAQNSSGPHSQCTGGARSRAGAVSQRGARPSSSSSLPPLADCRPRLRHGECAICGEALPQLPAASPGASLDRGFSGRGARPRAGTTSRPRVSPPSCSLTASLSPCNLLVPSSLYVTSSPQDPSRSSSVVLGRTP